MKILLTVATVYIGERLLPVLAQNGYEITCIVCVAILSWIISQIIIFVEGMRSIINT